jgi:hypothetical protein
MRDITTEEVIEQLEGLKSYCKNMGDKDNPNDMFHKDVIALDFAIARLKKDLRRLSNGSKKS